MIFTEKRGQRFWGWENFGWVKVFERTKKSVERNLWNEEPGPSKNQLIRSPSIFLRVYCWKWVSIGIANLTIQLDNQHPFLLLPLPSTPKQQHSPKKKNKLLNYAPLILPLLSKSKKKPHPKIRAHQVRRRDILSANDNIILVIPSCLGWEIFIWK